MQDTEKQPTTEPQHTSSDLHIRPGRPDIASLITGIVETADKRARIAVAACGPDSMMQVTRKTVAGNIRTDGPDLELYCEQFGW